jgi:glycosyltransferase involved in cell wall biosynthesis
MKIAFDLRRIQNPGIGRYMKGLTEAVLARAPEHEYLLVLPPDAMDKIALCGASVEKICSPVSCYSLREQVHLPRILRRHRVDVLHSPHFNLPLVCPCAAVVTLHDVIYLACKQDLPSRVGRIYYQSMMAAAVRRAGHVLTVSEFSKRDIVRRLDADPAKIEVVYPGVAPIFQRITKPTQVNAVLARYRIDEDYILYTGIYKLRKNHPGLMRAFREFLLNGGRAKLVIAGPVQEEAAKLAKLAAELGIAEKVVFTGFVPDEDLAALYSAARVYACPSLYEGFGFTVLEAMACGVPVVCSAETSLPEIAGDAALYADPRNSQEFARALSHAFTDEELRRQMIEKGAVNCLRFRWESAARSVIAVYRHAAAAAGGEAVCA